MRSICLTGGTGSFGRAFTARLLDDQEIERIAILSRDEHKQAGMAAERVHVERFVSLPDEEDVAAGGCPSHTGHHADPVRLGGHFIVKLTGTEQFRDRFSRRFMAIVLSVTTKKSATI